jgi:predicted metalloprotease with PDZ domain
MTRYPLILASSALVVAGAAAVSCRPDIALAEPSPAADAARREADEASLEAQLAAARKQLEAAAHQVAELSAQLSRPVIERFIDLDWDMWDEHGRAIIGVQLDPAPEGPGARVRGVSPGGPAAEAGIHAGDVVVAVNGTEVKGENPARQVMRLMREVKPDTRVSVRVLRDGSSHDYTVVAREGPNYMFAREGIPGPGAELLPGPRGPLVLIHGPVTDMELATLTPQLGRYFGSDKGVLVVRAPVDGALKLEDGDVILAIDGRQPLDGSHATRILASYQPGEKLTLRIMRLHKTLDVETTLPERAGHRHASSGAERAHGAAPVPPAAPLPRLAPPPPAVPPPPATPSPDTVMALRGVA